jgi:hypothetical protein
MYKSSTDWHNYWRMLETNISWPTLFKRAYLIEYSSNLHDSYE